LLNIKNLFNNEVRVIPKDHSPSEYNILALTEAKWLSPHE